MLGCAGALALCMMPGPLLSLMQVGKWYSEPSGADKPTEVRTGVGKYITSAALAPSEGPSRGPAAAPASAAAAAAGAGAAGAGGDGAEASVPPPAKKAKGGGFGNFDGW